MDRTATHSNHDELLIVRLFGGDVDDPERARALDQLGQCDDCATLFADLRAMADATAALPIPARPRDFVLTEADATRLRRAPRGLGFLSVLRRTRTLGGSLVAIGLVGIVATSSLGILGGTAGTFGAHGVTTRSASQLSAATAGSATTVAPVAMGAVAASSAGPAPSAMKAAVPETSASFQGDLDVTSSATPVPGAQFGAVDTGSAGSGVGSPDGLTIAAATTSPGLDARLVWLGGFGLLFLAGLGVLIVPLIRRRRIR